MILQSLADYYKRKSDLPRPGFERKEIPFIFELNQDGSVVQIEDTRIVEGNKRRAKEFYLPQGAKKSVNIAANLLWGNLEYVLGLPDSKKLAEQQRKGKETKYQERLTEMRQTFIKEITNLPPNCQEDQGIRAVLTFLKDTNFSVLERFGEIWKEVEESNPNISFRLHGDTGLVCQRQAVIEGVSEGTAKDNPDGVCLITGDSDEIERLHPPIRGVWGAQTSGANIVSFNLSAFNSWGKDQGGNAPVGKYTAFAYTTALNQLLGKNSKQRLQVGDASTVFWADKSSPLEDQFADIFAEPPKDDPNRNARALNALYEAPRQGVAPVRDDQTYFFVLGLAPNAARIAIRFWHVGTVAQLANNIQRHFHDLEIVRPPSEKPNLSVFRLLLSTAIQSKSENIPPNLGGDVMRSIMEDLPYPITLLQGAIRRVRAERDVSYPQSAVLKACLNRTIRSGETSEKEMTVSLDYFNTNPGYRLGRLFAVLEKVQEEANPGINATIRERFYGAASCTPVTVFSNLMKLKNHHLAKLENLGRKINLERLIGEIMDGIHDFPSHLNLGDQGRFAIGYYHQRQAFFIKTNNGN